MRVGNYVRRWPVQVTSALLVLSLTLGSLLVVVQQSQADARRRLDRNYREAKRSGERAKEGYDKLADQLRRMGITPTTEVGFVEPTVAPLRTPSTTSRTTTTARSIARSTTTRRSATTTTRRPLSPSSTHPSPPPPTQPPCTLPVSQLC